MQKTIHYRNVEWLNTPANLKDLIGHTLSSRPDVIDTQFLSGSETGEVRHRSLASFEVRLHIAMHIPGGRKAVSPKAIAGASGDLSETPPPRDTEFTEREFAVVIRPDRIGYVVAGRAATSTIRGALAALVELGNGADVAKRLYLSAKADKAAIKKMLESGVAKLNLDLSLPHANAMDVVDGQPLSMSRALGKVVAKGLSARFEEEHADAAIDELANMNVGLNINVRRNAPEAEIEVLTQLATEAFEENEEFTIQTLNKGKIKREELILTSTYSQESSSSVLSYQQAWAEISKFLNTV